ncbi:hypothetical protein LH400_22155 [Aurantimonas sp. VKM B-3413]|nr:hypothetical protein [Aurantimonas sp. VKM B-3413]
MELIQSVIEELGINLACAGIRSGDEVTVELWTSDGQFVDDVGRGVKVTFGLRRFKCEPATDLNGSEELPLADWPPASKRDAAMGGSASRKSSRG